MNRVFVSLQEDIDEPQWLANVEGFVQTAMKALNFDGEEVSVLFCNDSYMRELNNTYRHIDSSF